MSQSSQSPKGQNKNPNQGNKNPNFVPMGKPTNIPMTFNPPNRQFGNNEMLDTNQIANQAAQLMARQLNAAWNNQSSNGHETPMSSNAFGGNDTMLQPFLVRANANLNYSTYSDIASLTQDKTKMIVSGNPTKEMVNFYNDLAKLSTQRTDAAKRENTVGKPVSMCVALYGFMTRALVDTGAQASVINANFLFTLMKKEKINPVTLDYDPGDTITLNGAFGSKQTTMGSVTIPIERKTGIHKLRMHICNWPIPYAIVLGTASLKTLGFALIDKKTQNVTEFDFVENRCTDMDYIQVADYSILSPMSYNFIPISVDHRWNGEDVVIDATDDLNYPEMIVESSLVKPQLGSTIVKVLNKSSEKIVLQKGLKIAKIERPIEIAEINDIILSDIFNDSIYTSEPKITPQKRVTFEDDEWISGNQTKINSFFGAVEAAADTELSRLDQIFGCLDGITGFLTETDKQKLQMACARYQEQFAFDENDLSGTDIV